MFTFLSSFTCLESNSLSSKATEKQHDFVNEMCVLVADIYRVILCFGFTATSTVLSFTSVSYCIASAGENGKYKYDFNLFIEYFHLNRGYFDLGPVSFFVSLISQFVSFFLARKKKIILERWILLGCKFFLMKSTN